MPLATNLGDGHNVPWKEPAVFGDRAWLGPRGSTQPSAVVTCPELIHFREGDFLVPKYFRDDLFFQVVRKLSEMKSDASFDLSSCDDGFSVRESVHLNHTILSKTDFLKGPSETHHGKTPKYFTDGTLGLSSVGRAGLISI